MTNPANSAAPHTEAIIRAGPSGNAAVMAVQPAPAESLLEACACGHPHADHDAIAARYCAATIAGSLARGCVCRLVHGSPDATHAG